MHTTSYTVHTNSWMQWILNCTHAVEHKQSVNIWMHTTSQRQETLTCTQSAAHKTFWMYTKIWTHKQETLTCTQPATHKQSEEQISEKAQQRDLGLKMWLFPEHLRFKSRYFKYSQGHKHLSKHCPAREGGQLIKHIWTNTHTSVSSAILACV